MKLQRPVNWEPVLTSDWFDKNIIGIGLTPQEKFQRQLEDEQALDAKEKLDLSEPH